uniref:NACHT, LRR and PYD domains-containing protein 12-like n=1 Tax=Leptobrachium leishanense TaxID=445787 RepID=A0A8C5PEI6_9ANUR
MVCFSCCKIKCRESKGNMGSCISTKKSPQEKATSCDATRPLESQKSGGQGEGVIDPSASTKSKPGVKVKHQSPWDIERLLTPYRNVSDVLLCLYETQNERLVRKTLSRKCSKFKINKCTLTPSLSEELCSIIARRTLQSMTLTHVNLQDSEVKLLCEGLRHPDSVLQSLCLDYCGLTTSCCEDLHSLLLTLPSLNFLHLSGNDLQDSGVKRLCEDLKHPRCVLRHVGFSECNLTPAICDDIRAFILSNPSLYHLDLSNNKFQKPGVMRLCDVFRHPDCNLDELRLNNCGQGFFRIKELNSYTVKTPTATNVDLTFTALGDLNIHKICVTLDYPECNLQEMRLEHVCLTFYACKDLCTIIKNRSLLRLDLSHNYLKDPGMMRLRFGLTRPGCVLQELKLVHCKLTSYCGDDLRAIVANPSLIKLDLSRNKLQDSGVKLLCAGLQDARCVLQELRLERCGLTSSCCEDLLSVITNRSLIKLDLSRNNLQDSGVMRLCEGLQRPDCTLQELRLRHCNLTSLGIEYLQNPETHPLTKLDLS